MSELNELSSHMRYRPTTAARTTTPQPTATTAVLRSMTNIEPNRIVIEAPVVVEVIVPR
jgi:hypothetical protein